MKTVIVKIENSYSCGRTSERLVTLPAPDDLADLTAWWEDVVFEETGDGHPCGETDNAIYDVEIVGGDYDSLLGQRHGWG